MKQMKKLLAFVLAFAMIITIYQPSVAYAATKKPRLNAKTMTLQVGQKKTLKVKNAGKKKFNNGHCKGDRYHFYCDGTLLLFNHDTSLERQCGRICIQLSFNGVLFCGGIFLQKRIP